MKNVLQSFDEEIVLQPIHENISINAYRKSLPKGVVVTFIDGWVDGYATIHIQKQHSFNLTFSLSNLDCTKSGQQQKSILFFKQETNRPVMRMLFNRSIELTNNALEQKNSGFLLFNLFQKLFC